MQRPYSPSRELTCINLTKIPFSEELHVCVCVDVPSLHLDFPSVLELYRISFVRSTEYPLRLAQHNCTVRIRGPTIPPLTPTFKEPQKLFHMLLHTGLTAFGIVSMYTARPGSHAEAVADQKS